MCGIAGIASVGRCGGFWGSQLETAWTEGLEGREQLRVNPRGTHSLVTRASHSELPTAAAE